MAQVGGSSASNAPAANSHPRLSVLIRKRPLNKKEKAANYSDVVECIESQTRVQEMKLKVDLTKFTVSILSETFLKFVADLDHKCLK